MEKISNGHLTIMGCAIVLDSTLISVPAQIVAVAKADFWVSYLLAAIIAVIPLWLFAKLSNRFQQRDVFSIVVERRPVAGRIVSLLYIVYFLLILARDLRSTADFVNVSLLPMTPLPVIAAFIAITLILLSQGGIEIIARMNQLWQPVLCLVILIFPLLLFREFEGRHIQPAFEYGMVPALQGGWYAIAYVGEIALVPFLFPSRTFHFKSGFIGLLLGVFMLEVLNWTAVLVLGLHIPGRVLYPNYELVRQIRVTDFLDRFDLPLVGIWLPAMIVKSSFSLFAICHGVQRIIPAVSAKAISTPFGLLAFACSFWFYRNALNVFTFNGVLPAIAIVFEWFLPVLLFFWLRKKEQHLA